MGHGVLPCPLTASNVCFNSYNLSTSSAKAVELDSISARPKLCPSLRLASVSQVVAERTGIRLPQDGSKLRIATEVFSEVLSVFSAQRSYQRVAPLPANLAIRITTPTV